MILCHDQLIYFQPFEWSLEPTVTLRVRIIVCYHTAFFQNVTFFMLFKQKISEINYEFTKN